MTLVAVMPPIILFLLCSSWKVCVFFSFGCTEVCVCVCVGVFVCVWACVCVCRLVSGKWR